MQKLGSSAAQKLLSKSLFAIVVGSNDIFGYSNSSDHNKSTPQEYVDLMILTFKQLIKVTPLFISILNLMYTAINQSSYIYISFHRESMLMEAANFLFLGLGQLDVLHREGLRSGQKLAMKRLIQ